MSKLEKTIQYLSSLFLFLLPWQTILIFQEQFVNRAKWEYGTLGMYGTEMLGWVLVVLFMVWYVFRLKNSEFRIQNFSWSRDRIFVLSVLLFILYSLLLSFFVFDSSLAVQHTERILLGFLLFFLFTIGPVDPMRALWAFVLGSVPVSMLGLWQFLSQSTIASSLLGLSQYVVQDAGTSIIASDHIGRWLRAYGSFSHPNVFGGYLALALMSALLLYRTSGRWGRVVLHATVALQTSALFFTSSRSAWMSLLIGLVVYWFINFCRGSSSLPLLMGGLGRGWRSIKRPPPNLPLRKREGHPSIMYPLVSCVSVFILCACIYFPLVQTRMSGTSVNEVASITERADGYGQAKQLFQNNVWFGVGPGQYTRALIIEYPDNPGWWYQPVHVVPVLMLVEVGFVGLMLLLFVCVSFVRLRTSDFIQKLLFVLYCLPLLLLDHYLLSSYVGMMLLFVCSGLYFRVIKNEAEASFSTEN